MRFHFSVGIMISLVLLCSCQNNDQSSSGNVLYRGALKEIIRKGNTEAQFDLSILKDKKDLFALGAIENLKGEIMILNSQPINSFVVNDSLIIDSSFNRKATLLIYTFQPFWDSHIIPDDIKNVHDFEKFLISLAEANGLNLKEAFPFQIEGRIRKADWHVIDWKEGDTEHTHEKHKQSGLSGSIVNDSVMILGFYSNSHHGIFTHHGSNLHMHVTTSDRKIAGHLDDLSLGRNMILKLPEVQE